MSILRRRSRHPRLEAFLRGAGSVFDLGGTLAPRAPLGDLADDWRAVGDDMRAVMGDADAVLRAAGITPPRHRATAGEER